MKISQQSWFVDLSKAFAGYDNPADLFFDKSVPHMDCSTPIGCAKDLIAHAVTCSAKMNLALYLSEQHGRTPLADAAPYGDLLGAKHSRATKVLESGDLPVQPTDLSFAILDELVSAERLSKLSIRDLVRYRNESAKAREAFLEHLAVLQAEQKVSPGSDYNSTIKRLITMEVIPAAREFKNKLDGIYDELFGTLATGALTYLGSSAAIEIFTGISWPNLLRLAGLAGAGLGTAAIKALREERGARRECALSYLLGLDKN